MTDVITITVEGGLPRTTAALERARKFPQLTISAMREWGMKLERNTKRAAKEAGIQNSTGALQTTGIQWRQAPKGKIGRLFVRSEYVKLDRMRPHWVNITRSRTRLLGWGMRAHSLEIRAGAGAVDAGLQKKFPIKVNPHPFLYEGFASTRPLLRAILRRELRAST